jgi:putative tricarboxylic transport membrane protein
MVPRSNQAVAGLLLGLGVIGVGLFIGIETSNIQVAPVYAKVGPTMIPLIVAGGLVLLGAALALQAVRRGPADAPVVATPSDLRALLAISVGLWLQILLQDQAGFVIAAALLFYCVAWAFGSRRFLRDAVIAVLLAIVVYLGFTRGLDLALPAGVLAGVL